jgi:hypothetical protein
MKKVRVESLEMFVKKDGSNGKDMARVAFHMRSWLADPASFFPEFSARNAMIPIFSHEVQTIGGICHNG